ncbi:MAG: hypothetical protein L3K11_03085 [Thermoplasmata archaeon]|nr:hypothetical protein [Thermoplasmata archaeon]
MRDEWQGSRTRRSSALSLLLLLGIALLTVVAAFATATVPSSRPGAGPLSGLQLEERSHLTNGSLAGPPLALSVFVSSPAVCVDALANCPAQLGLDQVTLTAQVGPSHWPAVQVLFLVETTPYDGVYDPSAGVPGGDPCGDAQYGYGTLCEESNGVPFFVANANEITRGIAAAHPGTNFSFGLVDFFATADQFDAGGGAYYHVDVSQFLNASGFGTAVDSSFQAKTLGGGFILPHSDLRENFLHSSSITALYGALEGAGLNWSDNAHHVIVLLGSTAPRDPHYTENYCASPAVTPDGLANCTAPTCEPTNNLPSGLVVPACEGWVVSSTANSSADLAALAAHAAACSGSLGANCTVDSIDFYDTPTDPGSPSWSESGNAGGPLNWTLNSEHILQAGCDIAAATGGTWAGPSWYTCPNGWAGNLPLVGHGPAAEPNASNPKLLAALLGLGIGQPNGVFPVAGAPARPMFLFVPYGAVSVALGASFREQCTNATGAPFPCPGPTTVPLGDTTAYGWNISTTPFANGLSAGETWSSTFDVEVLGPPFATVPVDACITVPCRAAGSGPILGNFSSSVYRPYEGSLVAALSFPLAVVSVEPDVGGGAFAPPLAPIAGPPLGTPGAGSAPPPTSAPPPGAAVPAPGLAIGTFSAGVIAAGAIRLGIRGSGMGVKTAAQSGPGVRKRGSPGSTHVGRWV